MPTRAIRCGTLIDGTGADPVRGATIVVENDTIVALNRNGDIPRDAEVIDAGDLTGTLEPGKRADLLALDGDPLNDIAILQDKSCLKLIVKDGTVFKDSLSLATAAV